MSGRVTKLPIVYARADIPAWEKAQVESVEVLTKGDDDCLRSRGFRDEKRIKNEKERSRFLR